MFQIHMKYILFAVALLVFTFSLWRFYNRSEKTDQPNDAALTSIKFSDSLMEVGTHKLYVPVKANFVIYNTGKEDLYIQNVVPDCHCTVADYSKGAIHRSDSSIITLKYDASNLGPFQSSATVTTNSTSPTILLIFRGVVEQ